MKTLVLGNGAREHALAWAFSKSRRNTGLFCMPGNAGTEELAVNIAGNPLDPASCVRTWKECGADLVAIGPEGPLAAGVADALRAEGALVFGPGKEAARLEASKAFARSFSDRASIRSARTDRFASFPDFETWLASKRDSQGTQRVVLKKSGLAAGKGVLESDDPGELTSFARSVLKDDELLAEEFLTGYELSVFALTDGKRYITFPAAADHKKALPDNKGPNTGGMGAVCPVPSADRVLMERIDNEIVAPTFERMAQENLGYRGVVFFGVMVGEQGPSLLEYNVRWGDPETQSILPLLDYDIGDLFEAVALGDISNQRPSFRDGSAVGITIAAPGYPGSYPTGIPVRSMPKPSANHLVFHAATSRSNDGTVLTGGGRCFTAVGLGDDYFKAHAAAMDAAMKVEFDGAWYRPDIGKNFFLD